MPQLPSKTQWTEEDRKRFAEAIGFSTSNILQRFVQDLQPTSLALIAFAEVSRQITSDIDVIHRKNATFLIETIKAMNIRGSMLESFRSIFKVQEGIGKQLVENLRFEIKVPEISMPYTQSSGYEDELVDELIHIDVPTRPQKPYEYYPETKSLIINISIVGAINFYAKDGNDNMTTLIEILLEALGSRGEIEGGYIVVFVLASEILKKAQEKGKDADMNWLKHTRSNLVNSKIPKVLKHAIKISEYDKERKGYYFKIKISHDLIN